MFVLVFGSCCSSVIGYPALFPVLPHLLPVLSRRTDGCECWQREGSLFFLFSLPHRQEEREREREREREKHGTRVLSMIKSEKGKRERMKESGFAGKRRKKTYPLI